MKRFFANVVFAAAIIALSAAARADYVAPHIEHGDYGALKIVAPLTSADPKLWAMKLRNAQNAIDIAKAWRGTLDLRFVLWAQGVHLLDSPTDDVKAKIYALRAAGVKFEICANTLRENNIDFHTLYGVSEADLVPAGFLEVPYLEQREGFAVAPVN